MALLQHPHLLVAYLGIRVQQAVFLATWCFDMLFSFVVAFALVSLPAFSDASMQIRLDNGKKRRFA